MTDWLNIDYNNLYGTELGLNKFLMGTSSPINPDPEQNYAYKVDANNERDSYTNFLIRSVRADKISAGTIASNVIYAGSITASQISSGTISGSVVYAGSISADKIMAGTISAVAVSGGTISGGTVSGGYVSAGTIVGAVYRSSSSNTRVQIDQDEAKIRFYDSSGSTVLLIDDNGGSVVINTYNGRDLLLNADANTVVPSTLKFSSSRSTDSTQKWAIYAWNSGGEYGFRSRINNNTYQFDQTAK